ncbi:MAG: methionine gamma-lyase family protein [Clostridiales Family XIII bacterium]|jgi:cystathionine beta-lyase family protein involved in aluminum resistance|nr:methionine gamma-lyase family protein [Clostridiales Family XIII bacterium]
MVLPGLNIDDGLTRLAASCEEEISGGFARLDRICAHNQSKTLAAFRKNRVSESHFAWATGYGHGDVGREVTDRVFADVFGAETALVRPIITCGTHALSLVFLGILRPGDELLYCTGTPYDSLHDTIGLTGQGMGSLADFGVTFRKVDFTTDGRIDLDAVAAAIGPNTRMAAVQRATGYNDRRALTMPEIASWAKFVKDMRPDIVTMADNCYGEFLDTTEPTGNGVDIMAGSLIKNPGGGIALTGGYVAGRSDLVETVSYRMTCPGVGGDTGLMFGQTRTMLQGLLLAPQIVNGAVKGAMFCAALFGGLGFRVSPEPLDERSDIIETVCLGSPEAMEAFCEGIQAASPIDSFVKPIFEEMPEYEDEIIMAVGAFVQGSSIEMSADGPKREPYNIYFQGGLSYEYSKLGALMAAQRLLEKGLLTLP